MPPSCYDKAAELLARRPHFRAELAQKLLRRGYPREEIDEALARLSRQGYLDDAAAAAGYVEGRRRRAGGGEGRSRLRAELERRGAAKAAIETALGALPEDDLPEAREAARSWERRSGRRDLAALARHLARKGFSQRAIVAVLRERPGAPEATEPSEIQEPPEMPEVLEPGESD